MVSIIMPLYNAEQYMRESIYSLQMQTYKDIEIILIDDGSMDNTLEVAHQFADQDDRIIVLSQKNSGPGVARNAGLNVTHGEYVCFVDSDDVLAEDFVETLLRAMEDDVDLVQCRAEKLYADNRQDTDKWRDDEVVLRSHEAMKNYLYDARPTVRFSVWAKLYRKTVLNEVRFPPISYSEDVVFNAYAIDRCRKIKYIPRTLYYVVIREDSLSHGPLSDKKVYANVYCNELLVELIKSKEVYADLLGRIYWSSVMTMINNSVSAIESDNEIKGTIIYLTKKCRQLRPPKEAISLKFLLIKTMFERFPILTVRFFGAANRRRNRE